MESTLLRELEFKLQPYPSGHTLMRELQQKSPGNSRRRGIENWVSGRAYWRSV